MNYEELYESLAPLEKELKDSVNLASRMFKALQKDRESGNLADIKKCLEQLESAAQAMSAQAGAFRKTTESFDTKAYFMNGDFARQFLSACHERDLDIKGEKGVYEVFPYKVRILGDEERAEEVYIDRKKFASFRPGALADYLKTGRDKLLKANFNAEAFMKELAEAYDTTCKREDIRPGKTVTLTKIYKTLTPMARARKEYDMQAFAFDLARLYEMGSEAWVTRTGRSFYFGTSREGKNAIRVLSSGGVETYIATIKPLAEEEV